MLNSGEQVIGCSRNSKNYSVGRDRNSSSLFFILHRIVSDTTN